MPVPMRRFSATLAALSVAAAGLGGVSLAAPASAVTTTVGVSQTIDWAPCGHDSCARVNVPLDYAEPTGATISLALTRVQHTGDRFLGSLFVNPGGPGVPARGFAAFIAEVAPELAASYDIVAFDPRGVDASTPVSCLTGAQTTKWLLTDPTPDTPREVRTFMSNAASIASGCLSRSPALAAHIGTDDTARDLDVLRGLVGDAHLNLLGFSYGTALGTRYAELFPDRVGRFVLDGPIDPQLNGMQLSHGQSDGFQQALLRFAADCAKHTCVSRTRAGVISFINRLLTRVDRAPMPGGRLGPVDEAQALAAIFDALYSPSAWPALRSALVQAAHGSGAGLQTLASTSWGRIGRDRYADNANSAFYAISCWDLPATPPAPGLARSAKAWAAHARVPAMAISSSWSNAPCSTWFGHAAIGPHRADSSTTAPILVVGTRYDPATPYAWAKSLAGQLPTSRLLTYNGDGHTAFGGQSACIDAAVTRYLIDGTLPAEHTTCT